MSKRPSAIYNDPGYFYDRRRLGRIFAVAAGVLLVGLAWMIWRDFDRPWKDTQRAQMKWEARKLALEEMLLEVRVQDERARLGKQRRTAVRDLESKRAEIAELEARIREQEGQLYAATMAYNEQKQFTLEAEYHVHEAKSEDALARWKRDMRRDRDLEHRLLANRQRADRELNALVAQRKELQADLDRVVAEERKIRELSRLQIVRSGIEKNRDWSPLREIPLLDFLAPPTKVEQIVLDNLVDDYEFATPNKVDRCGTCHIGAMRVGFEPAKWPVGSVEGDPAAFEEAVYRFVFDVIESVTDKVPADDPYYDERVKNRKVAIHHQTLETLFARYDRQLGEIGLYESGPRKGRKIWRRYRHDAERNRWVESKDGRSIAEYYLSVLQRMEPHWRTHPHFDDMVGSQSPHPYERFGCTSCHNGRGWSTDFGFAWHNPDLVRTDDWMTEEWVHEKDARVPLSADYGIEEAMHVGAFTALERAALERVETLEERRAALPEGGGPEADQLDAELKAAREADAYASARAKMEDLEVAWVDNEAEAHRWEEERGRDKSKLKYWEWPQYPLDLVEASCLKCHKEGLYRTAEPEYADVRIGRPDADVPETYGWQDHALARNRTIAADNPANRMFIPEEPEPYRPEALERGLDDFLRFGCYGCHKLDPATYPFMENVRPKVGPPLDEVAAKVRDKAWLQKWVRNPKDFRPDTRMPRFFGLSNNSHDFTYRFADSGEDEPVDGEAWSEAEIYCVSEWIWHESRQRVEPDKYETEAWQGGDPERGRRILLGDAQATESLAKACIACHDVGDDPDFYDAGAIADAADPARNARTGWRHRMSRRQGPNLAGIASKVKPGWLFTWLKNPRGYWHETNMPDLRLTDGEARDAVAYLLTLRHEEFDGLPDVGYDRGTILRMAQEWKVAEQKEPMGTAVAIVEGWRREYEDDPRPASEKGPDPLALYVGEKLVKHYGCFGCHTIDAYKDATPIGTELTDWGSKLIERLEFNHAPIEHERFDFAYLKMRNPRLYDLGMPRADKPLERLRMPRFGFTSQEAKDLATLLVALVDAPVPAASLFRPDEREADIIRGRQIVRRYNCQGCHVIENEGGDVWPVIGNVKWRPPDLLGQGLKTNPAWLFKFMKDPAFVAIPGVENSDRVRPWHGIRMPTFHLTDEEARAVVRYFAALSRAPADFESAPEDSLTGEGTTYADPRTLTLSDPDERTRKYTTTVNSRLEEARMLFQELQCKSCHSPEAPIENQAPNFRHTREGRLREDWIRLWLWNPSRLQPGTAMPTFFANEQGPITQDAQFFAPGPDATQPDRQIRALRDYIRHHYREEDR